MKTVIGILSVLFLAGCGTSRYASQIDMSAPAPAEILSVSDLPKPSTSLSEIQKTGVIRVIAESAKDQSRFNAIEAAKGIAQKDILMILKKTAGNRDGEVVRISGTIRTFECGAFYDQSSGTAYACMEAPVK